MFSDLRVLLAAGALVAAASFPAGPQRHAPRPPQAPAIVVAELFTSEGCSSCPPAEDLLSDLVQRQPLAGVEVLALSEHVDYWDDLRWPDRFSSAAFSQRQSDYDARVFRANRIYTPQLVVDGQFEAVGSDAAAVEDAVRRAARLPKAAVRIGAMVPLTVRRDARVDVHARVPADLAPGRRLDVIVAVVEDNLSTNVLRGENGGRTLRHAAVVRRLMTIGTLAPGDREWSGAASVPLGADWTLENLRAIAFLQERDARRVVGAAATPILLDADVRH